MNAEVKRREVGDIIAINLEPRQYDILAIQECPPPEDVLWAEPKHDRYLITDNGHERWICGLLAGDVS